MNKELVRIVVTRVTTHRETFYRLIKRHEAGTMAETMLAFHAADRVEVFAADGEWDIDGQPIAGAIKERGV